MTLEYVWANEEYIFKLRIVFSYIVPCIDNQESYF